MSVTYEAKTRQVRYLAGMRVVVDLRIENRGTTAVEMPDPTYPTSPQPRFELSGPGGQKHEFRPNSVAREGPQAVTLLRVEPGETWTGDLLLSSYASVEATGKYTLRSWLEVGGVSVESPACQFEIEGAGTEGLATETSLGEGNSTVAACVELLAGGRMATSLLREEDQAHGEVYPLNRINRGATAAEASRVLAPYSKFAIGLTALRWNVAESDGKVVVSHSLNAKRVTAFNGAEVERVLPPVATEAGLHVAAVRASELVLQAFQGSRESLEAGAAVTVEKLKSAPAAAAMTISPMGTRDALWFVLAWGEGSGTRVEYLKADIGGKILARVERTLENVRPLGPAAAGWSTAGELRAALLVRNAAKATEVRVVEVSLHADLSPAAEPLMSGAMLFDAELYDARLLYFESSPGSLKRMGLVRTAGGKMWAVPMDGEPRNPLSAVPSAGPVAILPGALHWYVVWPENGLLTIGVL
jgi:hypothetical protein